MTRQLKSLMSEKSVNNYKNFEEIFLKTLEKHAPLKRKQLRANNAPYMTKTLRKAIMKRSELKTKYLKQKTKESCQRFAKQRNYCSRLYKKERKKYYDNLDLKNITDNKKFWSTIKPFFSEKSINYSKINLVENNEVISDDSKLATCFSNFFKDAVTNLNIQNDETNLSSTSNLSDPLDIAIKKFENHPSITAIRNNVNLSSKFNFNNIEVSNILKEISVLDKNKNGTFNNIPAKCLKETSNECAPFLARIWNEEVIGLNNFPKDLKLADVTPIFKKDNATQVKNYRPVSVLPTVSKIFERLMHIQIKNYIDAYLSPFLCGYRKGYNTQTALLSLIEKWKDTLDKKGYSGAILMDLSKAFDTINHELLIAKLHAYGFSKNSLLLLFSYLSDRWQRTKVNLNFSNWIELLQGVPQGSVLGPLLFNIYLNDLFYILKDANICNFADDTTPFVCDLSLKTVMETLESHSEIAITWFECNYMKLNTDKCHLLVSGHKFEEMWMKVGTDYIWENKEVNLLGVTIDNDLKFEKHISNLCLKAGRKLSALSRMSRFLSFKNEKNFV